MAGEIKNKASKSWISKIMNYIKNIPQDIKSAPKEKKVFLGSISITLGVIALANTIPTTSNIWLINFILAVLLFIIGYLIIPKKGEHWVRIAIPAGFTIFSAGVRVKQVAPALDWAGNLWVPMIAFGIILMAIGFYFYCKNSVDQKSKVT